MTTGRINQIFPNPKTGFRCTMHANAESAVDQGHVPIFIIPHAPSLAGRRRSHTTTGYTDTSDSLRLHSYPSASADKHTPAEIAEPLATSPSPGTMTEDGREADHTSRSLVNRGREHIAFGIPRWAAHRLVFLFNDFFFIFFFFFFCSKLREPPVYNSPTAASNTEAPTRGQAPQCGAQAVSLRQLSDQAGATPLRLRHEG